MKLTVSPEAAVDLDRLRAFLSDKNPAAAARAIAVLTAAVQSLETFPERGRPSSTPNVRDLIVPFGRSAYLVRYAYSAPVKEVVLLRIWHGREARDRLTHELPAIMA
jgi:plasmid stabilization system protein ParE